MENFLTVSELVAQLNNLPGDAEVAILSKLEKDGFRVENPSLIKIEDDKVIICTVSAASELDSKMQSLHQHG